MRRLEQSRGFCFRQTRAGVGSDERTKGKCLVSHGGKFQHEGQAKSALCVQPRILWRADAELKSQTSGRGTSPLLFG